jgi:hypothetical protein
VCFFVKAGTNKNAAVALKRKLQIKINSISTPHLLSITFSLFSTLLK